MQINNVTQGRTEVVNNSTSAPQKLFICRSALGRRARCGTPDVHSRSEYILLPWTLRASTTAPLDRRSTAWARQSQRPRVAGDDVGGVACADSEAECRKWPAIELDSGCIVGDIQWRRRHTCIVGDVERRRRHTERVRTRRASQKPRRHTRRLMSRTLLSTTISSAKLWLRSRAATLLPRRRLLCICNCSVSRALSPRFGHCAVHIHLGRRPLACTAAGPVREVPRPDAAPRPTPRQMPLEILLATRWRCPSPSCRSVLFACTATNITWPLPPAR